MRLPSSDSAALAVCASVRESESAASDENEEVEEVEVEEEGGAAT